MTSATRAPPTLSRPACTARTARSAAPGRSRVEWPADHVAWYIDGITCAQFDGDSTTVENGPMQIILDVMVDNTWQRSWNVGLLDSTLVRHLDVEYIRIFQQR